MKTTTKKITKALLTIVACVSFVLMCAERPDGSVSLIWSFGWLAAFALSAIGLDKLGAYDDNI